MIGATHRNGWGTPGSKGRAQVSPRTRRGLFGKDLALAEAGQSNRDWIGVTVKPLCFCDDMP
jgi:hypothetical protein